MNIKTILWASILLLVSGQVNAAVIAGVEYTQQISKLDIIQVAGGTSAAYITFLDDVRFELTDVSAIPIPAAIWLFGTALIGLVGFSRRSKSP